MVAARRDFEDFLIEHGFSPERALYWASALERAAHVVTQEEFEAGLERAVDKMTAIMREEFAKRDVDIAVIKEQLDQLVNQRREDREDSETQRHEVLERLDQERGEFLERLDQQRCEDLRELEQLHQEKLKRRHADQRERRAVDVALVGTLIALLLRIFGAI